MKTLVVFPHQLFHPLKHVKPLQLDQLVLYEHPHYFTKYKYNYKKLLLHRASMKAYEIELIEALPKLKILYVELKDKFPHLTGQVFMFDPIDKHPLSFVTEPLLPTPNLLFNKEDLKKYRGKSFLFHPFYKFCKDQLNVLTNVKSQDKHNRNKFPKNKELPPPPAGIKRGLKPSPDIKKAGEYITATVPPRQRQGRPHGFWFPTTRKEANVLVNDFFKHRYQHFGTYQDSITSRSPYLYHSLISVSMNSGLLDPSDVLAQAMSTKAPMNAKEGFVRQLFWREYQHFCYHTFPDFEQNYFNNTKKLTPAWYNGTLGVAPVDATIKLAFEDGYLHHINRLMVMGNYMFLSGISPTEGHKWFMEFSCDAYEWVMAQNVKDMVFCSSGGKTSRKPYISSSNYILKMSDYPKGSWCETWDKLYWSFLKKHKEKLHKFRYHFPQLKKV